jgi:hypothetical protein
MSEYFTTLARLHNIAYYAVIILHLPNILTTGHSCPPIIVEIFYNLDPHMKPIEFSQYRPHKKYYKHN